MRRDPRTLRRVTTAAAVTSIGLVTACGGTPQPGSSGGGDQDVITVASWGGRFSEAMVTALAEPFTEETGIEVRVVDSPGNFVSQVQAQHEAGAVQWDIIDSAAASDAQYLYDQGLLLDHPAALRSTLETELGTDKLTEYSFTFANHAYVIACADERVERCPTTIEEFFDTEEFPGRRMMPGDASSYSQLITILGQATGNPVDAALPVDIETALDELRGIKDSVRVWWTSGDQMEQALQQGEADLGFMYSGRAFNLADTGLDVTVNWAGVYTPGHTALVADGPNQEGAARFLEWIAEHPEAQAEWSQLMNYSVPHPEALAALPAEEAERLSDWPANRELIAAQDVPWYLANKPEIDRGIQQTIQGG
ncbi:extracellular solute-binding protein [Streptomyces sp. DSM 44915]|uniref:Extracellular solute-binding protein n=1 Tax=Streptomyces chisholmiae TaxID=3075540 RepID=A0ABU2JV25_9ACTN|nr:extracellular solute-binding protein [Streptomyces sp. DSM 44915]MDT0268842.1 extracellular solute-binding protein [Streptomyces sp. DSM 44915]